MLFAHGEKCIIHLKKTATPPENVHTSGHQNLEGVGEDYQEKVATIIMGTSHHLSHDISGGINYGDYGCLNIFAIICDNYEDVWKAHQTNVTNPPENGGG